jgi:hypothetical protein
MKYAFALQILVIVTFLSAESLSASGTAGESLNAPACDSSGTTYEVNDIDGLYAAVNLSDYQANPWPIFVRPGTYVLSANDPAGNPRANRGRLELQPGMALCGTVGDRTAAVIDASGLPASSYGGAVPNTGAIRLGNGDNSLEWLTVRNAIAGGAGIIVHLNGSGVTNVRIAHVASTGSQRGVDIRNLGSSPDGNIINADLMDNDLHGNRISTAQGMRIINTQGSSTSAVNVKLRRNRFYDNAQGLVVENLGGTTLGKIIVNSNHDRFYENGGGAFIGAAFGPANNNTVMFTAVDSVFENNNGPTNLARGGLTVAGAANVNAPASGSNNTAEVVLRNCSFANNQVADLAAYGAASIPSTLGLSATNNSAIVSLYNTQVPNLVSANSNPAFPEGMNFVTIYSPTAGRLDATPATIDKLPLALASAFVLRIVGPDGSGVPGSHRNKRPASEF